MDTLRARVPRILISGVSSGVGKSLIVTGLIVALRKQGLSVSCCVTGSALHQALIYTRLSRRYSHVIDRRILEPEQITATLIEAERGADIVLIDGENGWFDGVGPGDEFGSDADIAALTQTPALLVINAASISNSLAAIVRGFFSFTDQQAIFGLVANRLNIAEEVGPILLNPTIQAINAYMDAYQMPRCIGGIPKAHFDTPLPQIKCSQRENVTALPREFFLDTASLISNHIDLHELLGIAELAPALVEPQDDRDLRHGVSRIAVSDDVCFNVAYQDNLAWLSRYGAEIVAFSPLTDAELPKNISGLYLTGGYLDAYGEELSRNQRIMTSIKDFALRGGMVYSEGAGTAYLCQSYQVSVGAAPLPGVGLIAGDAVRLNNRGGIIKATIFDDSILGGAGLEVKGISTGEWGLRGAGVSSAPALIPVMRLVMEDGTSLNDGFSPASQALSTFQFLHFGSNRLIARALVDAAAAVKLP